MTIYPLFQNGTLSEHCALTWDYSCLNVTFSLLNPYEDEHAEEKKK